MRATHNGWTTDTQQEALEAAGWVVESDLDCYLECASLLDGILSFEKATGIDSTDGDETSIHTFYAPGESVSGEEILQVLYPGSPKTLREALDLLSQKDKAAAVPIPRKETV